VCFPLDILMVHSSELTITTDGECLMYSGFSLGKTIRFGNLEFIADFFGGLSSPKGSDSRAVFMGTTRSRSPSLWAKIEDSTKEFYMTSSEEGGSDYPFT
jgi:hypothetical protein